MLSLHLKFSLPFFVCVCFVSKYTLRVYAPTLHPKCKCRLPVCKHQIIRWWCSSLVTSLWSPGSFRSHQNRLPSGPAGFSLQRHPGAALHPAPVLETWFLRYHLRCISSLGRLPRPAAFWVGVIGGKFSETLPISTCSPFALGWLCQWRENSWLEVISSEYSGNYLLPHEFWFMVQVPLDLFLCSGSF